MSQQNELPNRKPTRSAYHDYNTQGAYFVTVCTQNKRRALSRVVGDVAPYKAAFCGVAVRFRVKEVL